MLLFADRIVWFGAGVLVLFVAAIFALFARGRSGQPVKAAVLSEDDRAILRAAAVGPKKNSGRNGSRKAPRLKGGADNEAMALTKE